MSDRFSDYEMLTPSVPLVDLTKIKEWFGVGDNSLDLYLTAASEAISTLLRGHLGRYLLTGQFREKWQTLDFAEPLRNLREYPLVLVTSGATIYNRQMGRVIVDALEVEYEAGYAELPADLTLIFLELVRQQMFVFGYETFGTSAPVPAAAARSVSIGNLKVDFGAPAGSANAPINLAKGAGGLTNDALVPYSDVLNGYRSNFVLVAT